MAIFIPNAGLLQFLQGRIDKGALKLATLHAYKSAHIMDPGDVTLTFLGIECDFAGYRSQTINDWGSAAMSGIAARSVAGTYTFTATGSGLPQSVYGIFVLNKTGQLLYAEECPSGPVPLTAAGDQFLYKPAFSERNFT